MIPRLARDFLAAEHRSLSNQQLYGKFLAIKQLISKTPEVELNYVAQAHVWLEQLAGALDAIKLENNAYLGFRRHNAPPGFVTSGVQQRMEFSSQADTKMRFIANGRVRWGPMTTTCHTDVSLPDTNVWRLAW